MLISQKKAVKKKLMAATSMLLIACIMLISASYAWFTLSTAPEVTGISTTVGANGNLEIALATKETWANPTLITSDVGDSSAATEQSVTDANITWGNLVDLADASYGLSGVTLMPARLNIVANDTNDGYKLKAGAALQTPEYGADGRVSELKDSGLFGAYSNSKYTILEDHIGVRIIGANSGMSDREIAFRNAKTELQSQTLKARSSAIASLQDNGADLAAVVIEYALDSNTRFDEDDVNSIRLILGELRDGTVPALKAAWDASVLAYAASAEGQKLSALDSDAEFELFQQGWSNKTYDASSGKFTAGGIEISLDAASIDMYSKIIALENAISAALTDLDTKITKTEGIEFSEISAVMSPLFDTDKITVNDIDVAELKAHPEKYVGTLMAGPKVQMPYGSGIYATVAEFVDNYSSAINVQMGDGAPIPATMITTVAFTAENGFNPAMPYMSAALAAVTQAGAPVADGSSTEAKPMDDLYGYAIDMFLRTNASDSKLKLQVDEAQRVYTESTSAATQGGGSNMTFKAIDTANFTVENMKQLMTALRVVFLDGSSNIVGVGVLDAKNAAPTGETGYLKADLKLCKYSVLDSGAINIATDADGFVSTDAFLGDDEQILMDMDKNTAMKLTALVYLDGDVVDNSMVSTAAKSMEGTLNLQFASTATLVPMDNTALFNYEDEDTPVNGGNTGTDEGTGEDSDVDTP